jgi:D-amino-acid dehydrogenase
VKIVVIGGGVAGMFSSYYLSKKGHKVTVVDKDVDQDRSSIFNAGFITPSFPSSGIGLGRILAAAIRPQGPLYFSLVEVLKNPSWFAAGLRNGLSGFEGVIHTLGMKSIALYEEFFDKEGVNVDLVRGVLALFELEENGKKTADVVGCKFVGSKEIEEMGYRGFGGGALVDEFSVNPLKLYSELRRKLTEMGVSFQLGKEASLKVDRRKATGALVGGDFIPGDAVIVAAGAGSREICRATGFDPKILPARGLAMVYDTGGNRIVEHPAFFEDLGISLGQHNRETFRMTSYFELVGFREGFADSRKEYIINSAREHITNFGQMKLVQEGVGYRPCAPDQLPVIGKIPGIDNAWIASGNCREGVILAPVTGLITANMISGQESAGLPVNEIGPDRFA